MSFVANQIINMMINRIKQNNPKITPYINDIMNGGNSNEILKKAINEGAISRQQWNSAKPLLQKYGKQIGINITSNDLNSLENEFNNINQKNNNGGFRF